ncbi:MAG: type II secretion system F family protein [Chloroflexi bacterium]|nr:type II secretion system F family protein [Dehalococcoidia bacterium]MCO5201300.1 type II secretion system F family protein [Chloroflexota bacterium]MCZ7575629.1 type II secretion system F family protein [Dehalococcoidia bacterium]NJD63983.1 type II secretion system F family protein [Chloroflexota bacterium]PWB42543.1 MAG: type II secretion system protein [Dehalococcoidia bacterium]
MEFLVAVSTFVTVTLMAYGLMHKTAGNGAMDMRLGGLRYSRPNREALPDPDAAFSQRVIQPLIRGISRRANSVLPSTMEERLERGLTQAGMKVKPGQFLVMVGIAAGVLPTLATLYVTAMGGDFKMIAGTFVVMTAFGIYAPRIIVLGRIKRRQKDIWRSLPDAFDLITASVEAGLGIDAAFTRVIEKVTGPFAEELTRTMREIQMGRSRRDAFLDMADRTGVEELRQLINAVVQAEAMGISIGGVIRVQTGVIRTKRRQKAEEQAFKAPIKMVFPLVFFIFPAIMIVIGGPAILQLKGAF